MSQQTAARCSWTVHAVLEFNDCKHVSLGHICKLWNCKIWVCDLKGVMRCLGFVPVATVIALEGADNDLSEVWNLGKDHGRRALHHI